MGAIEEINTIEDGDLEELEADNIKEEADHLEKFEEEMQAKIESGEKIQTTKGDTPETLQVLSYAQKKLKLQKCMLKSTRISQAVTVTLFSVGASVAITGAVAAEVLTMGGATPLIV